MKKSWFNKWRKNVMIYGVNLRLLKIEKFEIKEKYISNFKLNKILSDLLKAIKKIY